MTWESIKHFRPFEFDSADKIGSGYGMNLEFVVKLDQVREFAGIPLVISSGIRTPEHNATLKDSVDGTAHVLGYAADIRTLSSPTRYKILHAAFLVGFKRIGLGRLFIHLDDDPTKPQDVAWTYPDSRA